MRVRDRRILLLTAGTVAALSTAACSSSGGSGGSQKAQDTIAVSATDTTCDVKADTLKAGTHEFTITNNGSKVTEFYVYAEGDRIMGEVENIAPGVARRLLVELPAGDYQAACKPGMVGDGIRHDLTVTGRSTQLSDDEELSAAVDSYAQYVQTQVSALQEKAQEFADAIKAGDIPKAQALYPVARSYYERIEPVAESFGDLDPKIDARENDVEPGDTWTGFHVLERDLWQTGDVSQSGPVADQLVSDIDDLATRAEDLELQPLDLANGALGLLDEIATGKITGEEDRYSHTDLYDFAANLEGSQQAVQSLRPVIADRDPELATALDEQFKATAAELEKYHTGDTWTTYTDLTQDQLRALSDALNALAAQVSQVPAVIAQ
ncbi:iron uptake system protein EfeO [Petropleomorpha daqingensis]|uniref:Iron uptake system component EfeO n=1 Tax=Petropleomorpha daqingensis TaxID=2026353 RepID=A0A853CEA9_9ACTN|nr:iron uptake system protein EfeO [Petropleomorpha daqingensis]NYJ05491.1 iron uptake system component EfeO [Petropleomorpha daqingensis]